MARWFAGLASGLFGLMFAVFGAGPASAAVVGSARAAPPPLAFEVGDRHHHHHRHGGGGWDRGHHHHGGSNFSLFFDLSPPRYYAPPAYYAPGPNCRPIIQNGWWYGRPAQIQSTLCYDPWGNSYVVDGSAYVIRYLDGRPW